MKGIIKAIIIGVVIIAIGAAILIAGLALSGWTVGQPDFEMNRYEAVDENTSLKVEFGAGKLRTEYYDGEKIAIDYPTANGYYSEITEGQGELVFETKIKMFFVNIGKLNIPETVIYLPHGITYDLDVELGAGTVNLAGGAYGEIEIHVGAGTLNLNDCECKTFDGNVSAGTLTVNTLTCDTFEAKVSAGKFDIRELTCNTFEAKVSAGKLEVGALICPDIKTNVSAGTADINVNGIKSEYTILVSVSTGSCNVGSQRGTTDKTIDAHCSAGTININFSENGD